MQKLRTTVLALVSATLANGFASAQGRVPGQVTPYGQACNGSAGTPTIGSRGEPHIGTAFELNLSSARRQTPTILALGLSNAQWRGLPLPFDLAPLGAPGCRLHAAAEATIALGTDGRGQAAMPLALPNHHDLIGKHLYAQWVVLDPPTNRLGLVTSRGADILIGGTPTPPTLRFSQLDFQLPGRTIQNSDWGSIDVSFIGSAEVRYLNVAINGQWQVRNVPVASAEGANNRQRLALAFNLGNQVGQDVQSLRYDFRWTRSILSQMPGSPQPATVRDQLVVANSGFVGPARPPLQRAKAQIGAEALEKATHKNSGFPNQECGDEECTPTAVSNSLQFLNSVHNLGMNAADITIDKMKGATGFVAGRGSPFGWWNLKAAYMAANNLPITTVVTNKIKDVKDALDRNYDIEINALGNGGHTAAVVGMTCMKDGKVKIEVSHDTEQGKAGGTKIESITLDPATGILTGSPGFFDGRRLVNFVIESPKK